MKRAGIRNKWGAALLAAILLGLCGWLFTPYDPGAQDFLRNRLEGPSPRHWLGVDGLGRDFGSRLWLGTAHSILLGGAAAALTLVLSAALLLVEEAGPAWAGRAVRQLVSLGIAVPVLFVGLILLVFLTPSAPALVLAAGLGSIPFGFRQLRVIWLEQKRALHVLASQALGGSPGHLLHFSIWPNMRPQFWTLAKLLFAVAILELSGLSFLGLMGDPDFAELGTLLRQNQPYLLQAPRLVFWPGAVLSSLLLLVHLSSLHRSDPAGGGSA